MVKQQCGKQGGRPEAEQGDVNTTPARQRYWERNLSGEARGWFEEDARYFLHQSLSTPVLNVIARPQGAWLEDLSGKRISTCTATASTTPASTIPEVVQAVKKQLDESLTFCPRRYTNIPAVRLAKKLAEITPGDLCRSLFCPGGTDAIEMALKLAKLVTGRFKTISFWDSFHGAGFGASSVGGEEHFHGGIGPLVPGAFHVEFPNYYRNPWGFTRAGGRRCRMPPADRTDHAAGAGDGGGDRRAGFRKPRRAEQEVLGRGQGICASGTGRF